MSSSNDLTPGGYKIKNLSTNRYASLPVSGRGREVELRHGVEGTDDQKRWVIGGSDGVYTILSQSGNMYACSRTYGQNQNQSTIVETGAQKKLWLIKWDQNREGFVILEHSTERCWTDTTTYRTVECEKISNSEKCYWLFEPISVNFSDVRTIMNFQTSGLPSDNRLPGRGTPTTWSASDEVNLQSNPISVLLEPHIPTEGERRAFREEAFHRLCTMLPNEINPEEVKQLWEPIKTTTSLYPFLNLSARIYDGQPIDDPQMQCTFVDCKNYMERLDLVDCIVNHRAIQIYMSQILSYIAESREHWKPFMKFAADKDLDDMAYGIAIASKSDTPEYKKIEKLDVEHGIPRVMEVIQALIDERREVQGGLFHFLNILLRKDGVIPSFLLIKDVTNISGNGEDEGGYGIVHTGIFKGENVAVKVLRSNVVSRNTNQKVLFREALVWRQLNHENLLPFLGVYVHMTQHALVSPWMERGNLHSFLKNSELTSDERQSLICGVASGLYHLHNLPQSVVHGDLSGKNIVISLDGRPQIMDFGLTRVIDSQLFSIQLSVQKAAGTPNYCAPERWSQHSVGPTCESDVYSFAGICFEIFTNQCPWQDHTAKDIMANVIAGGYPLNFQQGLHYSAGMDNDIAELMKACWNQDPVARPTMNKVMVRLRKYDSRVSSIPSHSQLDTFAFRDKLYR